MSKPHVKNLQCLCVKDASAKSVSAAGGVFKAKIRGISNFRSSKSYGYGKISSIKTISNKEFRYRVKPPAGTQLTIDSEGPTYRIYVIPTQEWKITPPRTGDSVTLKDSSDNSYTYTVQKYHGVYTESNGVKVSALDIDGHLGSPKPEDICGSEVGYTCIGTLDYTVHSNPIASWCRGLNSTFSNQGFIHKSKLSGSVYFKNFEGLSGIGVIHSGVLTAQYSLREKLEKEAHLNPTFLDKLAGNFNEFGCSQKLYPNKDLALDSGRDRFTGPSRESGNLYTFIDDGVIIGNDYHKHLGQGSVISDDSGTWITPSSVHTEGLFQYKSEVTNFHIRPDDTRFRMRASAPMNNYESKIAPLYTIENITFSDPSGNIMIRYESMDILGDVDYSNPKTFVNYATYSFKPVSNTFDEYDWQRRTEPYTHNITGYQLSFDVRVTPRDDAFDEGFSEGFEEDYILHDTYHDSDDYLALDGSPLSTQDQTLINPTKALRISAVEICNSGGNWLSTSTGPRREDYFQLFLDVPANGRRLEKKILPSFFALADTHNSGIFPAVSSIWYHKNKPMWDASASLLGNNLDTCGSEQIVKALQTETTLDYAELHSTGPHFDSGKMIMKFGYGHGAISEIQQGAFGCAFDQSTCSGWYHPSGAFNSEIKNPAGFDNNYLVVESITLKVKAKKATDSRDYVLDVVGWSDDKLLNVTKAPSGFLQEPARIHVNSDVITSEGTHPSISGYWDNDDDLALSTRSLSEKEKYLETSGNLGGDHYSLTRYPVVTTTEFADYEIPLKIYQDDVEIGLSRNYNVSAMLEHLYLDIYPLPSGAAIASAHLLVRYAPQVALQLGVQGGECYNTITDERSEGKLFPTTRQSNDAILNACSGYGPISTITSIPHTYSTPSSIRTNYARRWKGANGVSRGPFDPDMFSFGFENPHVDSPFISGHYTFDHIAGSHFKPRDMGFGDNGIDVNLFGAVSEASDTHKNVGWRFASGNLFTNELPGYSGDYQTSDWTALSGGIDMGVTFQGNPLYGRLADAFDNIVRVSGQGGGKYIDLSPDDGIIDTSGGFSVFLRFTPDAIVSGVGYDLFNSGVLFSKWELANHLDFALGYKDGYLCGYAKDDAGSLITVQDDVKYSGYQYPLSVILTYNDHNSSGLKLYTDNEAYEGSWTTLRASSAPFRKVHVPNHGADEPCLQVGWSKGSGVGFNMLVSEFGLSTYSSGIDTMFGSGTNVVQVNPDLTYKQVTAQSFLEGHRSKFFQPGESHTHDSYKLPTYVDEDPQDWSIGDFRSMAFGLGFSRLMKRSGRDLINFHLRDSGIPYENKLTIHQETWPSTISSGVCYHTQIENDFLRFHLSDTSDNFHSVHKRITKSLPIGYNFKEKALVVETVLEHRFSGDIQWPECRPTTFHLCSEHKHSHQDHYSGPRLIVSLYTKKKEPYWVPNEDNWGLVNRAIHYVHQASGIIKFDSKFDYHNLIDESEKWALFPAEPRLTEFTEKYYSQDVDDMFLQYDLVYPSGGQFESNIDVHTAHVRMDDALIQCTPDSGILNLISSGAYVSEVRDFNLFTEGWQPIDSGVLNLNTHGPVLVHESGFEINISGGDRRDAYLPFRTVAVAVASGEPEFNLHTAGCCNVISGASGTFNLVTNGLGLSSVQMPLSVSNDGLVHTPSGGQLPLYTYAPSGNSTGFFQKLQLRIENNFAGGAVSSGIEMPVFILGSSPLVDRSPVVTMPLVVVNQQFVSSGSLSLVIKDDGVTSRADSSGESVDASDPTATATGRQIGVNLYLPNYGGVGSTYLRWFNHNYGSGIELRDNAFAAIDVGNEIRGVDLIGYGACDSDSPRKAIDPAIVTDETTWRPETCNEGGIFRAINTYSNSGAINFAGETGYSGNYYGFRKYTGLIPHAPYYATLKITTGDTDSIKVPRDFEEWEYGMCGPNWRGDPAVSDQGDGDCDTDIIYSGVKLIGDYPYMSGDSSITPISGRNISDTYGESVAVTNDLMVVSSPKIEIPDASGYAIPDAGALFLYRREEDVAGEKAKWTMHDKLMLPSGFRRDYVEKVHENLMVFDQFTISGRQWQIGQEGRQLGASLDVATSGGGERETIVAGAPFAKFNRKFPHIESSGIPTCMMVFVDKYEYWPDEVRSIINAGKRWEHLYKYWSAPWNAGTANEWQPSLDVKVIVYQLSNHDDKKPEIPSEFEHSFKHHYIPRMDDTEFLELTGVRNAYNAMYSGIVDGFKEMFPYPTTTAFKPHSGIPPIMGIFKENSHSTFFGGAFQFGGMSNEDVVDDFIDFYEEYSHTSGTANPEVPVPVSGHVRVEKYASEKIVSTTQTLINNTLDSGYLLNTNFKNTPYPVMSVITSGVGQKWAKSNATEFQIPPASGGRVYIFEKESGVFNCVQSIIPYSYRDHCSKRDPDDPFCGPSAGPFLGSLEYNDRFGHSVAISKDTSIISVGSPWTYVPCEVFERQDKENTRMYNHIRDWLVFRNLQIPLARYDALALEHGTDYAQKQTYHELDPTNKFWLRTDGNFWADPDEDPDNPGVGGGPIELYQPIYNYKYADIAGTGTWSFIQGEFCGSSRLGYSTSVSDDGDSVAFGAPTDSMNMFEDSNVWYNLDGTKGSTWASYTNAGAVRMFESKTFVPHSSVVEFTRFGNLDRSVHVEQREAGYYDRMDVYFKPKNLPFKRTEFSDLEIPTDAGLAFIITPEIDAASDEIIANIKNWLALGDRTLVLVGNDPLWEEDGLYRQSNDVLNKVLKKLGSRMRIEAADTEYEALVGAGNRFQETDGCVNEADVFADRYNVTKSKVPQNAHIYDGYPSQVIPGKMFAKGVGKIVQDLSDVGLTDYFVQSPCDELNEEVCNLPLKDRGDIRAEWRAQVQTGSDCDFPVKYWHNWPFHYANKNEGQKGCDYPESPRPLINRPHEDIVPILTAGEWVEFCWHRPEKKICKTVNDCHLEEYTIPTGYHVCHFEPNQSERIAFSASGDSLNNVTGESLHDWRMELIPTDWDKDAGFIDPEPAQGRDCILQGVANVVEEVTIEQEEKVLYDKCPVLVEEPYYYEDADGNKIDANNRVIILAHMNGESEESFTDTNSPNNPGGNDDQNIIFYTNLAKKDCQSPGDIVQLGGWTERTSFEDAYEYSILSSKLSSFGFNVTENAVYGAGYDIDATKVVDTVCVANPYGLPTDTDIEVLKRWLKNGNKKLIVTYNGSSQFDDQRLAANVATLLEKLGLESRPWSLPCKGDYFRYTHPSWQHVKDFDKRNHVIRGGNREKCCPYDPYYQKIDATSDIFDGCETGYGWNSNYNEQHMTQCEKVSFKTTKPSDWSFEGNTNDKGWYDFIPISGGKNAKELLWYNTPVVDECPVVDEKQYWFMNGLASGVFDVEPGSGYRIFIDWVSENKNEIRPIGCNIEHAASLGVTREEDGAANCPCFCKVCQDEKPCDCHDTSKEILNDLRHNKDNGDFFTCTTWTPFRTLKDRLIEWPLGATEVGFPHQAYADVRADSTGKIAIVFNSQKFNTSNQLKAHVEEYGGFPKTPRIVSISGCPLPIYTEEVNEKITKFRRVCVKREECEIIPEDKGCIDVFRPIKHLSEEYCNVEAPPCEEDDGNNDGCCPPRGETYIEDGPIIAAEEFEHFTAGLNGYQRSKIIVITDSTLVQGQCEHYRNDSVGENQSFLRSLYPISPHKRTREELGFSWDIVSSDRQFQFTQKLRAPERGSPSKYRAASGIPKTVFPYFGRDAAGTKCSVEHYIDNEDTYHPAEQLNRPKNPDDIGKEIKKFGNEQATADWNQFPKFSGDFLGWGTYDLGSHEQDFLTDASPGGGINELMKVSDGTDFLDLDYYTSGCPGDLFGWSVDLTNNKLIVGTPFNGFVTENAASGISGIVQWHEIKNDPGPHRSGLNLSQEGGAGAAFYFERTTSGSNVVSENLPWEFKQKIKPSSVNVGLDGATIASLTTVKGDHDLDADFSLTHGGRTDKFGYSVAIDADMVAIGAPHHDYETLHEHIYSGAVVTNDLNTAFQRKSFSAEFDIPSHRFYDLGSSGVRVDYFDTDSGVMVLNHGAVYNYRHSMVNWQERTKEWIFGEKLVSHGHHARSGSYYVGSNLTASGCENDSFGRSVSLFRSERGDSDYTLAVGSPFHDHPTSGNHITSGVTDAGAAYLYDAMLREQIPALPNSGSWIDVKIFGARTADGMNMLTSRVYQNTDGEPITYLTSGYVYANPHGDLYIEASGFDPSIKGFVAHRPFVESVIGDFVGGEGVTGSLNLITSGKPVDVNASMNVMLSGAPSANVYNNMNLRTFGVSGSPSGDMVLFTLAPSGASSGTLNLNVTSTQTTENLNLRLRGK